VIIDQLNQIWTNILLFTAKFVTPDWGALVGLIPIILVIAAVGPILTLLMIMWLRYGIRRPRQRIEFTDLRRPAELDAGGRPVFPAGEPYSVSEAMIYEPGATRSASGEDLMVACPKCGLVRSADRDTCANCGLSFTINPVVRSQGTTRRPTGGAAAA